jgi:hypothetical protein
MCDACNGGWHTFCLQPEMEEIPDGQWFCPNCAPKIDKHRRKIAAKSGVYDDDDEDEDELII